MPLRVGETLGAYEITGTLGAGGMGEVYRARDSRVKRDVAVKTSNVAFTDRFQREAEAIAALSHPNILTLHDVGTERGLWYAVTELLHGQTLRARMAVGRLPIGEAIEYAIGGQVAGRVAITGGELRELSLRAGIVRMFEMAE